MKLLASDWSPHAGLRVTVGNGWPLIGRLISRVIKGAILHPVTPRVPLLESAVVLHLHGHV